MHCTFPPLTCCTVSPVLGTAFTVEPEDTVVALGKNAVLRCVPPPSNPPAFVVWRKDNVSVIPSTSLSGNLYLSSVTQDMAGHYQCIASSAVTGTMRLSRVAQLTVSSQWNVMIGSISIHVHVHSLALAS